MENKNEFEGVWIPKEIWMCEELSLQEKVFFAEIHSLFSNKGCFASNNYFSKFFMLSPSRCSQIINELQNKGFIKIEYESGLNGNIIRRNIHVLNKLKAIAKQRKKSTSDMKGGTSDMKGGTSDMKGGTSDMKGGTSDMKGGTSDMKGGTSDMKTPIEYPKDSNSTSINTINNTNEREGEKEISLSQDSDIILNKENYIPKNDETATGYLYNYWNGTMEEKYARWWTKKGNYGYELKQFGADEVKTFIERFNNQVIIDDIPYDERKLFARLNSYAMTWLSNNKTKKTEGFKNNSNPVPAPKYF